VEPTGHEQWKLFASVHALPCELSDACVQRGRHGHHQVKWCLQRSRQGASLCIARPATHTLVPKLWLSHFTCLSRAVRSSATQHATGCRSSPTTTPSSTWCIPSGEGCVGTECGGGRSKKGTASESSTPLHWQWHLVLQVCAP